MTEKVDFRSRWLTAMGIVYMLVVAAKVGPSVLLAVIGLSCFLMATIIPGRFRQTCEQAVPGGPQRTWFER